MFHGTKNCNWVRNEFINKEHVKSEAKNYSIYRWIKRQLIPFDWNSFKNKCYTFEYRKKWYIRDS